MIEEAAWLARETEHVRRRLHVRYGCSSQRSSNYNCKCTQEIFQEIVFKINFCWKQHVCWILKFDLRLADWLLYMRIPQTVVPVRSRQAINLLETSDYIFERARNRNGRTAIHTRRSACKGLMTDCSVRLLRHIRMSSPSSCEGSSPSQMMDVVGDLQLPVGRQGQALLGNCNVLRPDCDKWERESGRGQHRVADARHGESSQCHFFDRTET